MDITAWSAVSPYGLDRPSFTAGLRSGRAVTAWTDPAGPASARACLVPGFDQREVLGRKGTKGMDRLTGLAVHGIAGAGVRPGKDTAIVLGTTAGSVRSMMRLTRASLTGERPFDVDPVTIPSAVMNTPAGHCAIWHGITGPNTTIASGRAAGVLGLSYARRLLRAGRASTVLCGAAEEYSTARSWLAHHGDHNDPAALAGEGAGLPGENAGQQGEGATLLGEGAAVLRLEPEGAPGALATVLGLGTGLDSVTAVVLGALHRAAVPADDVWAVVPSCRAERDELAATFSAGLLDRVPLVAELIGDTGAVSAVFQIAAALALGDRGGDGGGCGRGSRVAVVTTADPVGTTTAAVIRVHDTGEC